MGGSQSSCENSSFENLAKCPNGKQPAVFFQTTPEQCQINAKACIANKTPTNSDSIQYVASASNKCLIADAKGVFSSDVEDAAKKLDDQIKAATDDAARAALVAQKTKMNLGLGMYLSSANISKSDSSSLHLYKCDRSADGSIKCAENTTFNIRAYPLF